MRLKQQYDKSLTITMQPSSNNAKPGNNAKPDNNAPYNFAALDLGSNSFHLLIAEKRGSDMVFLDRRKEMVRLAAGLDAAGLLSDDAQERALESLRIFAERLDGIPKEHIKVVGTNTLRVARNCDQFLQKAETVIGVPIDIVSGSEEARLVFLGVARDFTNENSRRLVIDIGGGSTEFIVGKYKPKHVESLYMGCISHTQKYFPDGEITSNRYKKAVTAARSEIQVLDNRFGSNCWDEAVGSSGTIRTIEKIASQMTESGYVISHGSIKLIADEVIKQKSLNKLELPGLGSQRREAFPGGLAILHAAFLELAIDEMHVSDYSLKEGVIHELAREGPHRDRRADTLKYLGKKYQIDKHQAKRVEEFALRMLPQLKKHLLLDCKFIQQLISWAAYTYEIGLAITHDQHQKHGAYIIENADLPGFSRLEQRLLSFLIINHRGRLQTVPESYRIKADWALVLVFRLACLFNRQRKTFEYPGVQLAYKKKTWRISLPELWLNSRPLTQEDLQRERRIWRSLDYKLEIKTH